MSPSPSHEGDDEYSSHDEEEMDHSQPAPSYPGEDTRPTSQKELAGWYSYGWAAEVFVICAMGSFLPITLEDLARSQGVLLSDRTTSCIAKPPIHHNSTSPFATAPHPHPPKQLPACVVHLLGLEINTSSFAMYTFSLSVLAQSLLIISMSGAADHGHFRKTFLLSLAVMGAIATMMFIFVVPQVYVIGALLAIVANTCFGASFVMLNSFLPVLVRYHPSVQNAWHPDHDFDDSADDLHRIPETDEGHEEWVIDSTTSLLPTERPDKTAVPEPVPAAISPRLALSTRISSYGIGIGYIAGLLVQLFAILLVVATTDASSASSTFPKRLALFLIGSWWLVFSIPAMFWLRPRPGPPLPAALKTGSGWIGYITFAWKALFKTIGHARQLKDIVLFLSAWFLLSDSIATVSGTAVLFAKSNLGMNDAHLALISVIGTVAGCIGAFAWRWVSRLLQWKASQTIVACICLLEVIPLYGLLGFIPAVKRLGFLGLQQPIEIYFLAVIYGFVLGGISSYCRSFFGELIPDGFEAAFYALYAVTDKGSSVFGPAIVGLITDRYGDIRPGFVFLAALIALPLPLMLLVDVDRGKADAQAMVRAFEGKHETNGCESHRGQSDAVDTAAPPAQQQDLNAWLENERDADARSRQSSGQECGPYSRWREQQISKQQSGVGHD